MISKKLLAKIERRVLKLRDEISNEIAITNADQALVKSTVDCLNLLHDEIEKVWRKAIADSQTY